MADSKFSAPTTTNRSQSSLHSLQLWNLAICFLYWEPQTFQVPTFHSSLKSHTLPLHVWREGEDLGVKALESGSGREVVRPALSAESCCIHPHPFPSHCLCLVCSLHLYQNPLYRSGPSHGTSFCCFPDFLRFNLSLYSLTAPVIALMAIATFCYM